MSAVTNQPLPFARLEREKHIQVIFKAFKNQCGPSCECQARSAGSKAHRVLPDSESEHQLSDLTPRRELKDFHVQPPGVPKKLDMTEEKLEESSELDIMPELETVSQIHITAKPDLQGPQCVSRKIFSVATGGSKTQLFVGVEESSCIGLLCCGPARPCSMKVFDCKGRQVFYFERPFRVDACCVGCCLMEIRAYSSQKHLIGTVYQRWSMFTPLLEVCDSDGAPRVRIQGSCCPWRCFSNQRFQIVSNIGEQVGTIWKKWRDEHNMDHENFGLDVPLSLDSPTKLLLLAATFLLNHMFFEMS